MGGSNSKPAQTPHQQRAKQPPSAAAAPPPAPPPPPPEVRTNAMRLRDALPLIAPKADSKLTEELVKFVDLAEQRRGRVPTAGEEPLAIDFNDHAIGDDIATLAVILLRRYPEVQRLRLGNNQITSSGARLVGVALETHPGLDGINLGKNQISTCGALRLLQAAERRAQAGNTKELKINLADNEAVWSDDHDTVEELTLAQQRLQEATPQVVKVNLPPKPIPSFKVRNALCHIENFVARGVTFEPLLCNNLQLMRHDVMLSDNDKAKQLCGVLTAVQEAQKNPSANGAQYFARLFFVYRHGATVFVVNQQSKADDSLTRVLTAGTKLKKAHERFLVARQMCEMIRFLHSTGDHVLRELYPDRIMVQFGVGGDISIQYEDFSPIRHISAISALSGHTPFCDPNAVDDSHIEKSIDICAMGLLLVYLFKPEADLENFLINVVYQAWNRQASDMAEELEKARAHYRKITFDVPLADRVKEDLCNLIAFMTRPDRGSRKSLDELVAHLQSLYFMSFQ